MHLMELQPEIIFKYAKDNFADISGLAAHFQSFPFEQFSAHASVPEGTTLNRALEFDRGGMFSMSQTQQWFQNE